MKPESTNQSFVSPHQALDAKAHLLKNSDPESIRAFTDEIFNFPRAFPRMPETMENEVKDRLARAELEYRQGRKQGVHERDIVELVNSMADKLGAPSYAKTSLPQVRVLRMRLALASPAFMGTGLSHQHMNVGESVNESMSPLQAVHLLNTLIDQKFINPEYQLEPGEWEKTHLERSIKTIQQAQVLQASDQPGNRPPKASVHVISRKRDIHEALSKGISSLSLPDAMNLIDQAFATLKIDR